jgi:hypothetical protein
MVFSLSCLLFNTGAAGLFRAVSPLNKQRVAAGKASHGLDVSHAASAVFAGCLT